MQQRAARNLIGHPLACWLPTRVPARGGFYPGASAASGSNRGLAEGTHAVMSVFVCVNLNSKRERVQAPDSQNFPSHVIFNTISQNGPLSVRSSDENVLYPLQNHFDQV